MDLTRTQKELQNSRLSLHNGNLWCCISEPIHIQRNHIKDSQHNRNLPTVWTVRQNMVLCMTSLNMTGSSGTLSRLPFLSSSCSFLLFLSNCFAIMAQTCHCHRREAEAGREWGVALGRIDVGVDGWVRHMDGWLTELWNPTCTLLSMRYTLCILLPRGRGYGLITIERQFTKNSNQRLAKINAVNHVFQETWPQRSSDVFKFHNFSLKCIYSLNEYL